ncbi:hypothetical protein Tco_1408380 [Tanacetum coccineum]
MTSTGVSNLSNPFKEKVSTEFRLKREAAESAYEVVKEKDRTIMHLEVMKFLSISTKNLSGDDCASIVGIKHRHNVVHETFVDICYQSGISAGKKLDIKSGL